MNYYRLISKEEIQEMLEGMGQDFKNAEEALEGVAPITKIAKSLEAFERAKADLENIDKYTLRFFKSCTADENPDWNQERVCLGMCKPLVSKQVLVSFEQSEDEMVATTLHECKHASDFEDNPDSYASDREAECEKYASEKCRQWYDINYTPQTVKSNFAWVQGRYGLIKALRKGNYLTWEDDFGKQREALITSYGYVEGAFWGNKHTGFTFLPAYS